MEKGKVMEAPSLLSQDESDAVVKSYYSAEDVADAFVKQYYNIMQVSPKDAHNFYKDQSIVSHQCTDGSMRSATTLEGINEEIMASNIKEWNPDISTVHAQDSVMDSVIVGITGSLTDNDNVTRRFAQTFFLAPQEGGGFYVHNDILQFIEINIEAPLDDVANPPTAPHADDTAKESSLETAVAPNEDQTDNSTSIKEEEEDDTKTKVADSSELKDPPLPAEPKKKSQPSAWQTAPNMKTDAKKVSYASILAKEGSKASSPQQASNAVARVLAKFDKQPSGSTGVSKSSVLPVKSATLTSNNPTENMYDVKSIRVKDLPPKMTQESLLEVVKKFGPVKQKNIQIKEYSEDGYCYAFVEFDNPKSARTAVEARFIHCQDRECEVQYKRTSNQGGHNYMGKTQFGRGGFRNDNFWGREGEGRSSGNWGHKQNEHDNSGGQTRDHNYRRNRYFQDQPRSFN